MLTSWIKKQDFPPSSNPVFQCIGIWQNSPAATECGSLFQIPQRGILWRVRLEWTTAYGSRLLGAEEQPCPCCLPSRARPLRSRRCWQRCQGRAQGMALTPAWGRRSQPRLLQLPHLSVLPTLSLTSTGGKFSFAWRDDPQRPGGLQSPASLPHRSPRRPQPTHGARPTDRPRHSWVWQAGPPAAGDKRPTAKPSESTSSIHIASRKYTFLCETVGNAKTDFCLQVI